MATVWSESNIINSLSLYLASQLLAAGFLVYWHERDALQINTSPTGWYLQYSQNYQTYLANSTFQAAHAAAVGIVTMVDSIPANPRFVKRLTSDASVGPADAITVPAVSIEVGPAIPVQNYELGTQLKWRSRHLVIDTYVRDKSERRFMQDNLALWFDPETTLNINNHDDGSLSTIGTVLMQDQTIGSTSVPLAAEQATIFEVQLNARMQYVA